MVLWSNAIRLEVGGNGLSGTIAVNDGNWHHVACVYNPVSATPVELYVDGVLDAAGSLTVPTNTGTSVDMRIGQRVDGINHFDGEIDEVRVWNTAKSQIELTANMNNEMCSIPSDLVAYYRFNQGVAAGSNPTETVLIDDSGNGNNGTLTNMALNGATSNWVTGVTLTPGVTSSLLVDAACDSYTWAANSTTYASSGNYSVTLSGANSTGCDSILSLVLTINTANDLTTNTVACDSFTWGVNGTTYTSSTTVSETLTTGQGCSYLHTLNLTLGTSYDTTYQVEACGEFTWPLDGNTYTINGTYPYVMNSPVECDSIAYLDLFIIPFATVMVQDNGDGSLTASGQGTDYQWIDCATNLPLSGETSSTFTPTMNGSYAVYMNGDPFFCGDTSECIVVDDVGIQENMIGDFNVHPNPTNGDLTVDLGQLYSAVSISVMTVTGQELEVINTVNSDKVNVELKGASGIYLLKIQADSGHPAVLRVMKK